MPDQPNILLITSDQHRHDCLGSSDAPTRIHNINTPNLDRLRTAGMAFTRAFTPIAVCGPARQTRMSGVMPEVHGGLWNFGNGNPIPGLNPRTPTWSRLLEDAGYLNVHLGRWHVNKAYDATHFGYARDFPAPGYDPDHVEDLHPFPHPRVGRVGRYQNLPLEQSCTHRLADAAIRELSAVADCGRPWHVCVDFKDPHLACLPCEPFASMYPPAEIAEWGNFRESFENKPFIQHQQLRNWDIEHWTWKEWAVYLSGYFGMISQLDDAVGRILDFLEREKLTRNTIIIYTSDHGDAAGSHRMMDKHYVMYEEIVRVPFLVRWDETVQPESSCGDFISHYLDLGPTLLRAAGLPVPGHFQGMSFLPQLAGRPSPAPRDWIFSTYHGQQFGLYTQRMIRDPRYKFVWNATDVDELYDLTADPWELENLAVNPGREGLLRSMRHRVAETFAALGDDMVKSSWIRRWLTR